MRWVLDKVGKSPSWFSCVYRERLESFVESLLYFPSSDIPFMPSRPTGSVSLI